MIGHPGARGIPRHALPNQAVRQERESGSSRKAVLELESSTTQAICSWLSGTSAIALGRMSDAIGYLLGLMFEAWMRLDANEDSFVTITGRRKTVSANRRGSYLPASMVVNEHMATPVPLYLRGPQMWKMTRIASDMA